MLSSDLFSAQPVFIPQNSDCSQEDASSVANHCDSDLSTYRCFDLQHATSKHTTSTVNFGTKVVFAHLPPRRRNTKCKVDSF
mmetsp:Transcript_72274/g.120411  ORF Transcript_72274/g.120411 Transcript_72274/m.120411 type:complete len:82 (-) Transcript_72274:97-342(-)